MCIKYMTIILSVDQTLQKHNYGVYFYIFAMIRLRNAHNQPRNLDLILEFRQMNTTYTRLKVFGCGCLDYAVKGPANSYKISNGYYHYLLHDNNLHKLLAIIHLSDRSLVYK